MSKPEAFAVRHQGEWYLAYQVGPSETYPDDETYQVSRAMDVIYHGETWLAEWLEAVVPLRPGRPNPSFTAGLAAIVEKASALADEWDRLADLLCEMHGTQSVPWATYHACATRLRNLLIAGLEPLAGGAER